MLLLMEMRFFYSVYFFLGLNNTFFTGIESLLQSYQFLTCLYVALKKMNKTKCQMKRKHHLDSFCFVKLICGALNEQTKKFKIIDDISD